MTEYSAAERQLSGWRGGWAVSEKRFCLDPVHGPLSFELMGRVVITRMGRHAARWAAVGLTHHGSVGLFRRPHLDGVTIRTTDRIWPLHGPSRRSSSNAIALVQLKDSLGASFFRTAAEIGVEAMGLWGTGAVIGRFAAWL